ncbi:hypothetical protein Hanom_Chr12g01120041 [Helianthus anomalus]
MPIINPYSVFQNPKNHTLKKVKQLVGSVSNPAVKEFVQTFKFDSYRLLVTTSEHLVPHSLSPQIFQGTHIHFGAIRLALTFYERK